MDWNLRYANTKIAGLIDHTMLGPHPSKGPCGACTHLQEIMAELLTPPSAGEGKKAPVPASNKASAKQIQGVLDRHLSASGGLK